MAEGISRGVLVALEAGPASTLELAARFGVSRSEIYILLERHRLGGRVSRTQEIGARTYRYELTGQGEKRVDWIRRQPAGASGRGARRRPK